MKFNLIYIVGAAVISFASCKKDNNNPADPNQGVTFAVAGDQAARPGIATVFVSAEDKDKFNVTLPSVMNAAFQSKFQSRLMALNPNYTTNALGQTAAQFSGLLATDVLNASTATKTTFFDGTNVLTGRALADDVIDVELLLIFGGPAGTSNPGLTSDNVNANDKMFSTTFPYLATPH
ncbi:MAG TPA: DUF4331 family protein [Flavobacterium sp.]